MLLGSMAPAFGATAALDERDEAARWLLEARALIRSGRHFEGIEKFKSALTLAEQTGQPLTAALTLANLAEAYRLYGDTEKALGYYREALEKYRLIGHQGGLQATQEKIVELEGSVAEDFFAADPETLIDQAIERVRRRVKAREESRDQPGEAEYQAYLKSVKKAIVSSWAYPELAVRGHKEGAVEVEFTILQDGRLSGVRVVQSSKHPSLDIAAIAAVKAAAPFPKIPQRLAVERLSVAFTFNYVFK